MIRHYLIEIKLERQIYVEKMNICMIDICLFLKIKKF